MSTARDPRTTQTENGRTHEPSLRELTAELDGLRDLTAAKLDGLREVIDERHQLYKERADGQKTAVDAALLAQEKQTTAAFAASEKAIVKAEDAQRDYNVRSNEFRGALDDATKKQMSRDEANTKFGAQDEKIESLRKEIGGLRESRSGGEAGKLATREMFAWAVGIASIVYVVVRIATGH